jgi:glycosyltransferase involved in cell wall biosynthesis
LHGIRAPSARTILLKNSAVKYNTRNNITKAFIKHMDISVIVPFHNEKKYIEKCIRALLSQDFPKDKYEIFLVDNNSTDGSDRIVQKYRGINLLSENKIGSYAARNRGIEESQGKIIAFTDSDCVAKSNWLKSISEALRSYKTKLVQGRIEFKHRSRYQSLLETYEAEKAGYVFSSSKKQIYYGYTNNMAVRKEVFDSLGRFHEITRGGDVIFVQKVIEAYSCDVVRYSDDIRVIHLEIDSLAKYYQKNYTYGISSKNYGKIVPSRPLSNAERLTILRKIIRNNRYSILKSISLMLVLFNGSLFYEIGRLKGRLGPTIKCYTPMNT